MDVVVNPDGTISIPDWLDWLKQKAADAVGDAGWNGRDWLEQQQKKGDKGWDDLYDKAKKPKDTSGRKDQEEKKL